MNKKGFTLIELLAVIVILAIIALIATPIVLNIIEDSKKSATLRSAEFYMDAVDYAVANRLMNNKRVESGEYDILKNGNVCLKYDDTDNTKCVDELVVEVNGEKPNSGIIKIDGSQINTSTLVFDNGTVNKGDNGEYIYVESGNSDSDNNNQNSSICTLVNDADDSGTVTAGDKYQCKVKDNMETNWENGYYFYVLSTNTDGTVNLILDRNVYYNSDTDTGLTTTSNTGNVAWQISGINTDGPVTAMDYLYNATKSWNKVPNIVMNYTDEGRTTNLGYGSIVTTGTTTKITKHDGTEATVLTNQTGYENLKARLPYKSEVSNYSAEASNQYLYDNLDATCWNEKMTDIVSCSYAAYIENAVIAEGITYIVGVGGYYTLSSILDSAGPSESYTVTQSGVISVTSIPDAGWGVRPVITLEI